MSLVQQITALIHAHSSFAGPLSFVVALLGCLVGTNLIVPAGAIMTAMGVLTGAGVISWSFGPWAACGAALGMSASYTLGLRFGPRIQNIPLLRTRPGIILRARTLFERYGFAAILIAYFSGPLRAPTASVAAISGMRRGKFEAANIVSSLIWTPFAVGIGAIPGTMIEPNGYWLPIGLVLVPAVTVGISAAIMFLRARPVRWWWLRGWRVNSMFSVFRRSRRAAFLPGPGRRKGRSE
jgi:membrane-associated protein